MGSWLRTGLVAIAAGTALLGPATARADGGACAEDRRSFCSGVEPGQARLQSCLRSHWGDLRPSCRDWLDRVASATELFYLQCEPEIFDLCRTAPTGKGELLACLRSNAAKLSPTCRDAVDRAKVPD
jgi:hypothetical protein